MSILGFFAARKRRLKRVVTDERGNQSLHGYTYESNNRVDSPAFVVTSFTHPDERPVTLSERQIEMRYQEWTDRDDEAIKSKEEQPEWTTRKSSWHCVFCGKQMIGHYHRDGGPSNMECKKCGTTFVVHYPTDEHRGAGESFSLTYWH